MIQRWWKQGTPIRQKGTYSEGSFHKQRKVTTSNAREQVTTVGCWAVWMITSKAWNKLSPRFCWFRNQAATSWDSWKTRHLNPKIFFPSPFQLWEFLSSKVPSNPAYPIATSCAASTPRWMVSLAEISSPTGLDLDSWPPVLYLLYLKIMLGPNPMIISKGSVLFWNMTRTKNTWREVIDWQTA